jgi:hypothetical protein
LRGHCEDFNQQDERSGTEAGTADVGGADGQSVPERVGAGGGIGEFRSSGEGQDWLIGYRIII